MGKAICLVQYIDNSFHFWQHSEIMRTHSKIKNNKITGFTVCRTNDGTVGFVIWESMGQTRRQWQSQAEGWTGGQWQSQRDEPGDSGNHREMNRGTVAITKGRTRGQWQSQRDEPGDSGNHRGMNQGTVAITERWTRGQWQSQRDEPGDSDNHRGMNRGTVAITGWGRNRGTEEC